MNYKPEYILCRQIAYYLKVKYPNVIFHFDYAGNNLSKAQSGMMKMIQGARGFPDLFIIQPKTGILNNAASPLWFPESFTFGSCYCFHGLFIELKTEGSKIYTQKGTPTTPHIAEQIEVLQRLNELGYIAVFGIGFDDTKEKIDFYLNL